MCEAQARETMRSVFILLVDVPSEQSRSHPTSTKLSDDYGSLKGSNISRSTKFALIRKILLSAAIRSNS
jgi:hypothetical protein